MTEADIEKYLVARVKARGGEVRKVQWVGRRHAPDRLVLLPFESYGRPARVVWVELKHPAAGELFPRDARERAQHREHERMRSYGMDVRVIWRVAQIGGLFA